MTPDFYSSLEIMWKGMFGIFSVILLIMFLVIIIQWFEKIIISNKKEENQ